MSTQQTTNPSYLARWEKHLADLAKNDAEMSVSLKRVIHLILPQYSTTR